jgi:PAS domain S-box-containing protein
MLFANYKLFIQCLSGDINDINHNFILEYIMLICPGYSLQDKIVENKKAMLIRAHDEKGCQPVTIKVLSNSYPSGLELEQFSREFDILCKFNNAGIIKAHKLVPHRHTLFMVLDDFKGICLENIIYQNSLTIKELLGLSIQIADILDQIHQSQIIHKNINPGCFLFKQKTARLIMYDFSIAVEQTQVYQKENSSNMMEGTLHYISPEQTGRLNRGVDFRTDYYSFGVMLYALFTKHLPFQGDDPALLVYSHIAHTPKYPSEVNPDVPELLSDIIIKLMAKSPENRYQTAYGIRYDLEQCYKQFSDCGVIQSFALGSEDISDRFQMPEKLYGREIELQTMLHVFERVAQGKMEMLLVAGYSGSGKTALVEELMRPIIEKKGIFIEGKFDQYSRDIPYAGLSQAFDEFISQVLAETKAVFDDWKETILLAVGEMGKLLTDLIPNLKLIIGAQPSVSQVDGKESQNRFNYVFQKFIQAIATKEHPLVLFLDDLQWIDAASLGLLQVLTTDPEQSALLLIGAYRNNEVDKTHPLMLMLEDIKNQGVTLQTLTLQNLTKKHVNALVQDTLNQHEIPLSLSALLFEKTYGNPLFLRRLFYILSEDGHIVFNPEKRKWECNINALPSLDIADNVVALLSTKIKKLPSNTRNILKFAACIGNRFDIATLSAITKVSDTDVVKALELAFKGQFILLQGDVYHFVHDRVQEAAYSLINESQKNATHLQIGRLLLERIADDDTIENIFDIVNQFNKGIHLIDDAAEKVTVAKLNHLAATRAKVGTGYQSALCYLSTGIQLLSEDEWNHNYQLMFALHKDRYECEYLTAQFEKAEESFHFLINHCRSNYDKSQIYNIRIVQCTMMAQHKKAIMTGRSALKLYHADLPEDNLKKAAESELGAIRTALQKQKIADLINHPDINDPEIKDIFRLLMNLRSPAYLSNTALFRFIMKRIVNISLQHGNTVESPYGYAAYGAILGPIMGDYKSAYEFGELGIKLSKKQNNKNQITRAMHMFAVFVNHWRKPAALNLDYARQVYQNGLECGELLFAGFSFVGLLNAMIFMGESLQGILKQIEVAEDFARKTQNSVLLSISVGWRQFVYHCCGNPNNAHACPQQPFDEKAYLLNAKNNPLSLAYYHIRMAQCFYIYKKYEDAFFSIKAGEKSVDYVSATLAEAEYIFYGSLTLCRLLASDSNTKDKKDVYLQELESNQVKMKMWAENCPENFLHKYLLVCAELAHLEDRCWEASGLYRDAISESGKNGFIQIEALANELAAEFYNTHGFSEIAEGHFKRAHYGYKRWGAVGKAKEIAQKQLGLLSVSPDPSDNASSIVAKTDSQLLDLSAMMKASQAISKQIVFDQLLQTLMIIVIQNAGAQRGVLLLEKNGSLFIEAEGTVGNDKVSLFESAPMESKHSDGQPLLPTSLIHYVARKKDNVVLNDAFCESRFTDDPYIVNHHSKSILCSPILQHGKLMGVIYLENNLSVKAFTRERLDILNFLSSQIAISIENARLYTSLDVSEKKYRSIFDNAVEGIFQTEISGKMLTVNPALIKMFGYTSTEDFYSEDHISQSFYADPSDRVRFLSKLTRDGVVSNFEFDVKRKDGSFFSAIMSAKLLPQKDGRQIIEGVLQDITAKRDKEKAIHDKKAAEAATRAKSEFLAKMSHEIRTPMNAIIGLSDLALRQKLPHKISDYLKKISISAQSLLGIINDILDFSKIEAGHLSLEVIDFSLEEVLDHVANLLSIKTGEKGIELLFAMDRNLPVQLKGDPLRLTQVLINLSSNAVKFTHQGQIVLSVTRHALAKQWTSILSTIPMRMKLRE